MMATPHCDETTAPTNRCAFGEGVDAGILGGVLDAHAMRISESMKIAAACVSRLRCRGEFRDILPDPLDQSVAHAVAEAVRKVAVGEELICIRNSRSRRTCMGRGLAKCAKRLPALLTLSGLAQTIPSPRTTAVISKTRRIARDWFVAYNRPGFLK